MTSQNIPGKGTGDRDVAGDDVAAALAEVARLDAEAGAALDAAGAAGTLVPACPGGAGAEEARSAMIAAQGQAAGTL